MMDNLSDWLAEEIKTRGWTIRELARRAGISHTTVADVISGQRQPTWDFCAAIAEPLGLTPVEVFRKAGLLRPSKNDEPLQELIEIINQLSPANREFVLKLIRATYREQAEEEAKKKESEKIPSPS